MKNALEAIKHFNLHVSEINNVPDSFSSEVYKLLLQNGETAILKIPYNKTKLFRERIMLERLQGQLPVPRVIDFWEGDESIAGAFLLSYIHGEPISNQMDKRLAYEIGSLLARLHSINMPGFGEDTKEGFHYVKDNDWWQDIRTKLEDFELRCAEILDASFIQKCITYYQDVLSEHQEVNDPCAIHMDFRPGNILIQEDLTIRGLIDFENARGGLPEIDFTKIKQYVWDVYPGTKEEFLAGYKSLKDIPNLERLLPFYSFYHAFGGIAWCQKRGIEQNKEFLAENIRIVKEIIS
jgi:aminoglycoside phosphotransferase (APT) family kinase protein